MNIKSLLLLLISCVAFEYGSSQTKHALIVAIGNYPDPDKNGWIKINSVNDVDLIKNALLNNQKFAESNIQVLIDSQATKKGIVGALDKLIASVNKGDIVVIHFSSHGEQIEDDNDDEIDGLDETIVPYGAVYSTDPAKFQSLSDGYLRDDLFGEEIIRLRNKLGSNGDLLVIIDACHSGTGTRGAETAKMRGGNAAMVSNKFSPGKFTSNDVAGVFKEKTGTKLSASPSSFVVISGAQAREVNYECRDDNGRDVGSLSYSFSKAISSLKEDITYRALFAIIENIMREKAPKQKPALEGDGIDRQLFGGKYEKQQPYFSIDAKQSSRMNKNDQLILNAGFVSGITIGSVIDFFPTGTTSVAGKKALNSGKVISISSFTSVVKLDSADAGLAKTNPWGFVSELSYGAEKIKLSIRSFKGVDKIVQESLKDFQLIEFNTAYDLLLDTAGSVNNWALKYPNTNETFQDGFSFPAGIEDLKAALKRFGRFHYLKGLTFTETGISADVQLVFVDAKGNIDTAKMASRTHLGRIELKDGDQVYLRIINTGTKSFYINIVDVQPDGIINPILPNKNLKDRTGNPSPVKWEDCFVKKYDTLFLRNLAIGIAKPYGEETFKIFLSSSAIDLEDILTSKNETEAMGKRGVLSDMEKIFVNSNINEAGKRGVEIKVNADQNGTVSSLNFTILPD